MRNNFAVRSVKEVESTLTCLICAYLQTSNLAVSNESVPFTKLTISALWNFLNSEIRVDEISSTYLANWYGTAEFLSSCSEFVTRS